MSFNNKNRLDDITYGIESTIWQSIEKSIQNDSIETFKVLDEFVIKIILLSIRYKSISHFKKYIIFPSPYYYHSHQKTTENIKFLKLHRYCLEISAMHLKEIISYSLAYNESDIVERNFDKIKINNQFLYFAFNGFNRLIFSMIQNGDVTRFEYVLNEFFLIDQLGKNNFYELKNEIRYYFRSQNHQELELKKELFENIKFFEVYKNHVVLGLRYWSIFLYDVQKNSLEVTIKYLNELKYQIDVQELLKDIINLRNNSNYEYFEWHSWDYKERPNGKAYSPPSVRHWLTFGFLIDLLRQKSVYLTNELLTINELNQVSFFYSSIKEYSEYLLNNFEYWKEVLLVYDKIELNRRIESVDISLKNLIREGINAKDREIADQNLSNIKIQDFKNLIGNSWKKNSTVNDLFSIFKNFEIVDECSSFIGQKIPFEKGKKMFIDGDNYQPIHNVSEIGGQTARWIDDDFFNLVIANSKIIKQGNGIIETLDNCISSLEEKSIKASIALIPSEFSYKEESFLNNKNFKRKFEIEKMKDVKYFIGTYKTIDIYISYSNLLENKIIVCDFEHSFKMKYKTNPDWFEEKLKVDVNLIDNEKALEIYNNNPNKWLTREYDIQLEKEEALVLIKNGVELEIGYYSEFEIVNNESFALGLIQNKTNINEQ